MLMFLIIVIVVMMLVLVLLRLALVGLHQLLHHVVQRGVGLHGLLELLAGQLVPGGRDQGGPVVVLTDQLHGRLQLGFGDVLRAAQHDAARRFDLVVVELTEVLHIELDLRRVGHSHGSAENSLMLRGLFHRHHDVGELAHAGGLDQNAVGVIVVDDLLQRGAEVAHQGAADAAGVHLGDLDAGLLQKAAVDADLAKFVLDQNELLALVGLGDHLLDQRGFACAEETGINVDHCHKKYLLFSEILWYIISQPVNSPTGKNMADL